MADYLEEIDREVLLEFRRDSTGRRNNSSLCLLPELVDAENPVGMRVPRPRNYDNPRSEDVNILMRDRSNDPWRY